MEERYSDQDPSSHPPENSAGYDHSSEGEEEAHSQGEKSDEKSEGEPARQETSSQFSSSKKETPPPLPRSSTEEKPVDLGEEAFAAPSSSEESEKPRAAFSLPGPGLGEALLWTVGVFVIHIAGFVGMVLVAVLIQIINGRPLQNAGGMLDAGAMQNILNDNLALILGGEQLFFVVCAYLAATLRMKGNLSGLASFRRIPLGHFLLILFLFLPLAYLSGEAYRLALEVWEWTLRFFPQLEWLDNMETMEVLKELSNQTSLGLMLVIMAVLPALGEEVVFRGVIGRGLVARWGPALGVLIATFLFAAVHQHPAHVAAVIPLGLFIHFVYLATRSFWAPVLLHFLNNAWAVVVTRFAGQMNMEGVEEQTPVPPELLISAALCVGFVGLLIWQTRVRFELPDGSRWSPGYPTVETPPSHVPAVARCNSPRPLWLILAVLSILLFAGAFIVSGIEA